ncbi:MAG: branched-chain amino acid transport system substrate-binding protein [Solirubrobacteraceae bacterium]|nr:branched-chain amino acid transport system substrate-binding protein [Solirubrobacteraceae bacterium]
MNHHLNSRGPRLWLLALLVAACAVAAGCGGGANAAPSSGGGALKSGQTYKVGYAVSKTGRLTFFEEPFLKGLELGIEQINAAGGIDGKVKIQLEQRDSRSDPSTTGTVSQELIDDGVKFLITPCDADVSLPGGQAAQRAKIPVLNSCGSGSSLPSQVGNFQFMNVYGTVAMGAAMSELALSQGHKSAYVMSSNDIYYTQSTADAAQAVFKKGGGQITGSTSFKISQPRYPAQATAIAKASPAPDALLTSIFVPDSVSFLKQLRAEGYRGPVYMNDGNDAPILFDAGAAANNVFVATHAFAQSGNETEKFAAAYKQKYGKPPESVFAAVGGDAARLIAEAVKQAGTTDPQAVRDAFANLANVDGVTGKISYKGSPTPGVPIKDVVFEEVKNGKFVFVKRFFPKDVPAVTAAG